MSISFFRQAIVKNRDLVVQETAWMRRAIEIIRKRSSGGAKLTGEEMAELKSHAKKSAVLASSALALIAIPFGFLLFPLYTEFIDRRRQRKN